MTTRTIALVIHQGAVWLECSEHGLIASVQWLHQARVATRRHDLDEHGVERGVTR